MIFTIDNDNTITAHETAPAARDGVILFASEKEFAKATAEWPIARLVETWNGFAGVVPFDDLKPVKKFENRQIAVARIWKAVQKLAPKKSFAEEALEEYEARQASAAPADPPATPKTKAREKKAAKPAKAAPEARAPREGTAKAKVIEMLNRKGGVTLDEIMEATGWQAHTVRGFISTLPKKGGPQVTSTRRESDKARVYEVAR
jgi:hypothetical protein